MWRSTGTGSQGEPGDPAGGWHLSGEKLMEAGHRLRRCTSGLQPSNCGRIHLQSLTPWIAASPSPLSPILSYSSNNVGVDLFSLPVSKGLFSLMLDFRCISTLWRQMRSILWGTRPFPQTPLPQTPKVKFAGRKGTKKHDNSVVFISSGIHSRTSPQAVKACLWLLLIFFITCFCVRCYICWFMIFFFMSNIKMLNVLELVSILASCTWETNILQL